MTFRDNPAQNRFEYEMNGALATADYRRDGGTLHINYVFAPEALRGTGAAGKLMKDIMETARRENLKIVPRCGYAASWIAKNGEYEDLLA
jgi:predicted GNAT family acetyltransferase